MKPNRKMLTNTAVEALRDGDADLWDAMVPGLHVRTRATGKAFYLYFRTKEGVERRPKLGAVGIVTLAQARENAREMLSQVAAGKDPMADRMKARGEPTMNDVWAAAETTIYGNGLAWDREAKRLYHAHAAPRIGSGRVRHLGVSDVMAFHGALKDTPIEGNRVLAVVSRLFSYAEQREWRTPGSNPCQSVQRYPELKRKRFARPGEIGKIGPILEREAANPKKHAAVAFLYLLVFSGARPSEIEKALPSMIERVDVKDVGRCGVLRLDRGKTGQRDVFLPPQAMKVIDQLPLAGLPLRNRHRKVLAMTVTGLRMPRGLWDKVREEAGCPDLWARDWRRTFATVGFSGGEDKHMVSDLLGHASIQTTNIYALLMQDPAFAAAARIATRMDGLLTSTGS